ncbi:MAG: HEAT repeat domain-containing protein [Lentisphaeria bacterium]|nr:HEAT repeat domain-containing protein [Lentisphaeria bacterium]
MITTSSPFNRPPGRLFLAIIAWAALCLADRASGGPGDGPPPPPSGGGEEQSQTVRKCLGDLAHDDAGVRLGAVMLLGKYPQDPAAQAGLTRALADADERVRRGAVVSLADTDFIAPQAAQALLNTLGDPDVHTRRLVASMLNRIVPMLPREVSTVQKNGALLYQQRLASADAEKLSKAFADNDPLVRKNMLAVEGMLRDAVSADRIADLLTDPDPETRAMAIPALRRRTDFAAWLRLTAPLTADPAVPVRRALAAAAAAERDRAAVKTLHTLAEDADITVRAAAVQGLFYLEIPIDNQRFSALINSPEIGTYGASELISLHPVNDAETKAVLTALTRHVNAAFRASALKRFATVRRDLMPGSEELLPFLSDSDRGVRQAAQSLLLIRGDLTAATVTGLISSPYPDTRAFALIYSRTLPEKAGTAILEELLLDEDTGVRQQVLAEYGRRKHADALDILGVSLEDDNADIRLTAATVLLRMQTVAARQVLTAAAREAQDTDFKRTLTMFVLMMKQAEAANRAPSRQPGER